MTHIDTLIFYFKYSRENVPKPREFSSPQGIRSSDVISVGGLENGGHVSRTKAQYPARPIVGRVAGTPAERVAIVVVSSPAPASRVASAKVWTWFRRVRPINPLGFSPFCKCDFSWWKKMACNRAAKSGFAAEAQRKVRNLSVESPRSYARSLASLPPWPSQQPPSAFPYLPSPSLWTRDSWTRPTEGAFSAQTPFMNW